MRRTSHGPLEISIDFQSNHVKLSGLSLPPDHVQFKDPLNDRVPEIVASDLVVACAMRVAKVDPLGPVVQNLLLSAVEISRFAVDDKNIEWVLSVILGSGRTDVLAAHWRGLVRYGLTHVVKRYVLLLREWISGGRVGSFEDTWETMDVVWRSRPVSFDEPAERLAISSLIKAGFSPKLAIEYADKASAIDSTFKEDADLVLACADAWRALGELSTAVALYRSDCLDSFSNTESRIVEILFHSGQFADAENELCSMWRSSDACDVYLSLVYLVIQYFATDLQLGNLEHAGSIEDIGVLEQFDGFKQWREFFKENIHKHAVDGRIFWPDALFKGEEGDRRGRLLSLMAAAVLEWRVPEIWDEFIRHAWKNGFEQLGLMGFACMKMFCWSDFVAISFSDSLIVENNESFYDLLSERYDDWLAQVDKDEGPMEWGIYIRRRELDSMTERLFHSTGVADPD